MESRDTVNLPAAAEAGRRRARDPRSAAVVAKLLPVAEALFAARGIDNVSLREIAVAAGSKNNNVVQYHFGTKEKLLHAIFKWRVTQMEARRGEMLAQAQAQGLMGDTGALLEIICLPHLEVTDEQGHHPYTAFVIQYAQHSWRADETGDWTEGGRIGPNLHRANSALLEALAPLRRDVARARIQLSNFLFLSAIIRWDQQGSALDSGFSIFLNDALRAAKAALAASVTEVPTSPFAALFPALEGAG
ncbi:TetR/AcrR family transcriptional regulator [Sandaracinobacter sp. RS1-74]|uniref:TetR/AcrR family transcriptional regulator n=1 Tax=Sandaracinobacteroides sayramensis TaxID=2913411 RepID=UPI001EDA48D0|nr:helix-turn-helix domain-containing protein [Sandaracinobacteroides sayramensis]MCG2840341.1 TetR/AcrR family transcriptional regulator [Sandaracinobacteroides sayramensis]